MIGIVFFVADTFFFIAYNNNADAFTVSSIVLMFPAAASVMTYFWNGVSPIDITSLPMRWLFWQSYSPKKETTYKA